MTDFVDVSSWQATADLAAYKAAGYSTVSLRATDGPNYTDPTFAPRWQQAKQLGLTRWAYHFARPGDAKAQAQAYLGRVHAAGGWQPGDVAMLDTEWFTIATLERLMMHPDKPVSGHWRAGDPKTGVTTNVAHVGQKTAAVHDRRSLAYVGLNPADALAYARIWFATVLADNPAAVPMIYANGWYLAAAGITQTTLPATGYVIAAYASDYTLPPGWDHACGWQFTDSQRVPGFTAGVDCNHVTCPSAPPFSHLDTGDISMADAASIEKQISNFATLVAGEFEQVHGEVAEVSTTTHEVGSILEYGTADRTKHPNGDGHYGFKQAQADIKALQKTQADQGALLAKIAAKLGVE